MAKVNRNDPCPCGSGKKYKKCCMLEARHLAGIRAANREGVQKAVSWITKRHGDAFARWVEDVWFADVSEEERTGISTADPAIKSIHDTNLLEQMMAEGVFEEDEKELSVLQLSLDGMPEWEDEQRAYLEQLGNAPLRLYRVTRCDPGEGFELQRYPADGSDPVYIEDKWVSRMLDAGDTVGLRLMLTDGCRETSGAVYHIPEEYVADAVQALEAGNEEQYSRILIRQWLGLVAAHV